MSVVGTPVTFDPNLVVALLRARNGQLGFIDTIEGLKAKGFDESASRELVWHAVALGLVQFTDDRASLHLSR